MIGIPDESTILKFRHLLESRNIGTKIGLDSVVFDFAARADRECQPTRHGLGFCVYMNLRAVACPGLHCRGPSVSTVAAP